jgi:lactate dehydrogenase-like 2-hydroxyacid dehydrogenase
VNDSTRPVLLSIRAMLDREEAALDRAYVVHWLHRERDPAARETLLARVAPSVQGLVTGSMVGADAALIDRLPRVGIIACFGVGVDTIDVAHARSKGIVVTNTPDVLDEDVADMALALLFAASRQIPASDAYVRSGAWLRSPMALTHRVHGKRVGIVGLGRIGLAIARRCEGFGLGIAYHGPRDKAHPVYRYCPDLAALARDVDFLVLACPGGPQTRHLVDARVLDALGPEGILVNVARGSVVDETALIAALATRRIRGAGLDVFADEPRVPDALVACDNVVFTPHCASGTYDTRHAMGQLVLDNLAAHFAGRPVPSPV